MAKFSREPAKIPIPGKCAAQSWLLSGGFAGAGGDRLRAALVELRRLALVEDRAVAGTRMQMEASRLELLPLRKRWRSLGGLCPAEHETIIPASHKSPGDLLREKHRVIAQRLHSVVKAAGVRVALIVHHAKPGNLSGTGAYVTERQTDDRLPFLNTLAVKHQKRRRLSIDQARVLLNQSMH